MNTIFNTLTALAEKHAQMVYPVLADEPRYREAMREDMTKYFLRFLTAALDELGVERAQQALNRTTQLYQDGFDNVPYCELAAEMKDLLTTIRSVKNAGKDL